MQGLIQPLLNLSSSARQSLVSFMFSPVCEVFGLDNESEKYPPSGVSILVPIWGKSDHRVYDLTTLEYKTVRI